MNRNNGIQILYYYFFLLVTSLMLIIGLFSQNFGSYTKFKINSYAYSLYFFWTEGLFNYYNIFLGNSSALEVLQQENLNLKKELAESGEYKLRYNIILRDMESLSALLGVKDIKSLNTLITTLAYNNTMIYPPYNLQIKIGKNSNVTENMLVLSTNGVIGYVSSLESDSATIITTINPNFKISANTEQSHINVIVSGNGTINPDISIYSRNENLVDGEIIYTSGLEGYFLHNIPIGKIYKNINGIWKVALFDVFNKLEYIHLVK
jgi:cell shape-determining protein MreC